MSKPVISTSKLSKVYAGVPAVDAVSFSVEAGEIVGFVGLNGAGKSTTINMLMGFLHPTQGSIRIFGEEILPQNAHRSHRRIGFATGDMSLFDHMTGRQYHAFVARSYGVKLQTETYRRLSARFQPQLNKKIGTLSRGNRQKIALIGAFMIEPQLVILDEPSSGLDPLMQQHFLDLIREQTQRGTTIFMSSHYLKEVVDVCTRILLIKNGVLVKDIPTSQLEVAAGKHVRVVTKVEVTPIKDAQLIERETGNGTHVLEFVTKEKPLRIQTWIGSLPNIQDFTVTDHDSEAVFEELYTEEAGESNV